jgi:hypothetical protein
MGLVRDVDISKDGDVAIELRLTTPGCIEGVLKFSNDREGRQCAAWRAARRRALQRRRGLERARHIADGTQQAHNIAGKAARGGGAGAYRDSTQAVMTSQFLTASESDGARDMIERCYTNDQEEQDVRF